MVDLARIKRNVAKMAAQNAPEADIDGYIASEGATVDAVRSADKATGKINLADVFAHQTRTGKYADPASAPQVDGNPQASNLPGVFGQLQNTSNAFQTGATQGMTANFPDEIGAGLAAIPRSIVDAAQGNGFDYGRAFNAEHARWSGADAGSRALNPGAANAGSITGGLVLGNTLASGGVTLSPSVQASIPRLIATGAAEGGLYGAANGFGSGDTMQSRLEGAGTQGLWGALAGAILSPILNRAMAPSVPKSVQILDRTLRRDGILPADIPAQLANVGQDAVIADLGPNLQQQAAGIATQAGPARTITDALRARAGGANARIRGQVDATLGPSRSPQDIADAITTQQQNLGPAYDASFTHPTAVPADVTSIVNNLDGNIQLARGPAQRALIQVREMLNDARTGLPTTDPRVLHQVRQAIDGMMEGETNSKVIGVLTNVRQRVDSELATAVPTIKQVDARYEELARQKDALAQGGTLLNDGKTALPPDQLDAQMRGNSRAVNTRLSEGARADIERIIGTKANDRVALQQIIKGEGSWNYEKLVSTFGANRADRLFRILRGERMMAETENLALHGARTSPLESAKKDLNAVISPPGPVESALSLKNWAKKIDDFLAGLSSGGREATVNELAQALVSNGLPPHMAANIAILRGSHRPILPALMAAQSARFRRTGGAALASSAQIAAPQPIAIPR